MPIWHAEGIVLDSWQASNIRHLIKDASVHCIQQLLRSIDARWNVHSLLVRDRKLPDIISDLLHLLWDV